MLRFSDGESFDTSGPYRAIHRKDGWYVIGKGMLAPASSREDAEETVKIYEQMDLLRNQPA